MTDSSTTSAAVAAPAPAPAVAESAEAAGGGPAKKAVAWAEPTAEAAAAAGAAGDVKEGEEDDEPHKHHPFFHYYGMLVHQQNMLQDVERTGTYQNAMLSNKADFEGKVVLDVGTGSGILAYFAVQAGAARVYGVEASEMAAHATKLMAANGLSDKITIIKGKVETVKLPEKVDVIISEPMGFVLVHERMLESYVLARERFLKPGGKMFPTVGTIYVCPFSDDSLYQEQQGKSGFWQQTNFYGLNMNCLYEDSRNDHFAQPVVGYFDPKILLARTTCTYTFDFSSCSTKDLQDFEIPLSFEITHTSLLHGIACWFDVTFDGSTTPVVLSTAPEARGTHWYQCRLLLKQPLAVNATQMIGGSLKFVANDHYSYTIYMTVTLEGTRFAVRNTLNLHDQMYHYLTNSAAATSASGLGHAENTSATYY